MRNVTVSQRGIEIPPSAMRKLAPLAEAAKKRGVRVIHLNIGQPDIETPPEFLEAVRHFPERTLAYAPSEGRPECVEGMLEYYAHLDIPLEPQHIVITTAGSESLLFALLACCDVGDEVIVPEPFYSNYGSLATMTGLRLVPFLTRAEEGYRLPPREEIERLIGEHTRAILYSSPANPTGAVYTPEEVAMLARSPATMACSSSPMRSTANSPTMGRSLPARSTCPTWMSTSSCWIASLSAIRPAARGWAAWSRATPR